MISQEPDARKQLIIRVLYATGGVSRRSARSPGVTRWRATTPGSSRCWAREQNTGRAAEPRDLAGAGGEPTNGGRPGHADLYASRTGKPPHTLLAVGGREDGRLARGLPDGVSPTGCGTPTSATRSTGRAAAPGQGHRKYASLDTTSAYAHARPTDPSARYLPVQARATAAPDLPCGSRARCGSSAVPRGTAPWPARTVVRSSSSARLALQLEATVGDLESPQPFSIANSRSGWRSRAGPGCRWSRRRCQWFRRA